MVAPARRAGLPGEPRPPHSSEFECVISAIPVPLFVPENLPRLRNTRAPSSFLTGRFPCLPYEPAVPVNGVLSVRVRARRPQTPGGGPAVHDTAANKLNLSKNS